MQSLWQYFRTFTVPSFATTGARVVLDGVSGTISVYNSSNQKTAQIGGSSGQILAQSSTVFAELLNGALLLGKMVAGVPDTADAAQFVYVPGGVDFTLLKSHLASGLNDAAEILLFPGAAGLSPPQIGFRDALGTAPIEAGIFGAHTYMDATNALEVWQLPNAATNWSMVGTNPLKFRRDGNDMVVFTGSISYTGANITNATGFSNILSAAVGTKYRPLTNEYMQVTHLTSTSVVKNVNASAILMPNGNLSMDCGDGQAGTTHDANAFATGDIFTFNCSVPLGNIQ